MVEDEKATINLQKYLENLAKTAFDEYKILSVDIPNRQSGYLKTYLWLASVLVAAELSLFNNILSLNFPRIEFLNRLPNAAFYIAAGTALACAVIVFTFGVDTLRGRKLHSIALGDLNKVVDIAKTCAATERNYNIPVICAYNNAINHQAASCHQIGVKLRRMSLLILLSVFFAIISIVAISAGRPVTPAGSSPSRPKEVICLDRGEQGVAGTLATTPHNLGGYPYRADHDRGEQRQS